LHSLLLRGRDSTAPSAYPLILPLFHRLDPGPRSSISRTYVLVGSTARPVTCDIESAVAAGEDFGPEGRATRIGGRCTRFGFVGLSPGVGPETRGTQARWREAGTEGPVEPTSPGATIRVEVMAVSRVLVGFATTHGSTREVAEGIAKLYVANGAHVRLTPVASMRESLAEWDFVVLGAPIYWGLWHRDAHRFIRRYEDELDALPVAVFGLGPRRDDAEAWQRSRMQLDRALAAHRWLIPMSIGLFGGTDPRRHGHPERRDLRDWTAIHAWASEVLAQVEASVYA
jgi:menaquinone-dependent protoporphyrinogen oxidase